MAETVNVALAERAYDIIVSERALADAGKHIAPLAGKQKRAIIVTDEQVARFYLHRLSGSLEEQGVSARTIILPPGEGTKSFSQFESLLENILEQKPDRGTLLVALGGGVIGDITGFAASVVLRGLDFVQIPTTLLAQVDSSVGGKTAINSRFGKNLIGSFHQPKLVLVDVSALKTLPPREMLAGYAEIIKYGFIDNPAFFSWLETNGRAVLDGEKDALIHAVTESCRAKAAIVSADEKEGGVRALLNFGHTFAHAFEAETGYGAELLHGEAVALGMVLAFRLSVAMGLCPNEDLQRVLLHYEQVGMASSPLTVRSAWNIDALMEHFTRDKKVKDGRMTFVLARGIGAAFVTQDVSAEAVRALLVAATTA